MQAALGNVLAVLLLLTGAVSIATPPNTSLAAVPIHSGPTDSLTGTEDHPSALRESKPTAGPSDELAVPEYPSSSNPRPLGEGGGPVPLLANAIVAHHFDDAWALGYRGGGVRVAVVDEGVDFGHLDLQGTQATVTNATSKYVGWPIAYDTRSLSTYLRTGYPDGTWFANTTSTGAGPFVVKHTVTVDGTNDFGDRERWGIDSRDNSAGAPGGDKEDYDLTDLYVTRDDSNWYFGFPVYLRDQNASFVLLIDADNETSGAYVSPHGYTVNTNTSHSDRVNDVAWSPDGTRVASVGGDRVITIWDRNGGILHAMPGHPSEPLSVAWSPDGATVASADKDHLRLWNPTTGQLIRDIQYVPSGDPTISENGILAFSPNGTWIAAGTFKFVHVFNVATGVKFGSVFPANTDVNALSFHPVGDRLAVGLGDNSIRVYAMVPGTFNTPLAATPLFALAGHAQSVVEVAWSPDGTKLVSGGRDDTVRLWDTTTQTLTRTMLDHDSWVLAADWSPTGAEFVTTSRGLLPSIAPSFAVWDSAGTLQCLLPQTELVGGADWSILDEIATASEDQTVRAWTSACNTVRTFVAHRPDYALHVHGFSRYSDRENKYTHGTDLATFYRWDVPSASWVGTPLANVSGRQAAFQFGDALFNEFAVPRNLIAGDPAGVSVEVFSAHENGSRAQDTVPADRSGDFRNLDFTAGWSSLSAFAFRQIQAYRVSGLTSLSGAFHFGFHPGPSVQRTFGALGLLVADSAQSGAYDRVYLDMNDDKVFDATDVVVSKSAPIAAIDNYNRTAGGPGQDGYPDVSAGMIYFIADGVNPIPYSNRLAARKSGEGLLVRVPPAGDLVAFAGEFGIDPLTSVPSEHGTRMASAIVAQGRLPIPLVGTASESRLVAILNGLSDVVEAWTFAVEGYDGRPNTEDDAHVVVNGFNFPTLHHDGWDSFSRTADYLSAQTSGGDAVFVASVGDHGFGYGTALSPASGPSVIAAGRAGDFTLRSSLYGGNEGPNPHARNPAIPGSRGPSAQGFLKPEILAVDTAALAVPLHVASDGSAAISSAPAEGSDVSAAIVAGAVAVVRDAFVDANGRAPTVDEVRAILFSGADDVGHDVLTQGAGFLNVSRAAKLAARTADAGLEVSPPSWQPGSYRTVAHLGFTRLMAPGVWEVGSLSIANRGTATVTASVEAVSFVRAGGYTHTNVTVADPYQPAGDIALWVNDTGLWKVDGATLTAVRLAPPVAGLWTGAELVKVTAVSDLDRLGHKVGTSYLTNYSYVLKAYDWGIDWANWPPGVDPFPARAIFPGELNTIAETFHQSNALEVRAGFPGSSLVEGLVISLEAPDPALAVMGLSWTFEIEFYDRVAWSWVDALPPSITIPAGGVETLSANLSVPGNAGLGSYEAAILLDDPLRGVTTVPILVNVGAGGPRLSFGGNLLSTDLYDNNRLFGGYDRSLASPTRLRRPTLGDWRFFFFDIPDQGVWGVPAGYKILVRTDWVDAPSDLDTFAFGRTTADVASQGNSARYGAFTLRQVGKSEELDKPDFQTATGGGGEVIAYDLSSGLNVIALRAFAMRGLELEVRLVSGEAGWVNTPTGLDVSTRFRRCDVANATVHLGGCAQYAFLSNMDLPGLRASAVGPSQTTAFTDAEISQDVQSWWNFPGWGEWMFRGSFSYVFQVEKALILEVAIQGKADTQDLDMAVFRDGNENGEVDPEEYLVIDCQTVAPGLCVNGNLWNYNADGDADERVPWINPPDGQYIVKVLGYTVLANPGHFDLQVSITLATGKGFEIYEAPKPAEVVNGTSPVLPALTRVSMNMTWDFPTTTADDAYGGAVLLGLPNAPGVIVVPVVVLVDRAPPDLVGFRVNALNGRLSSADNATTNDRAPQLVVSLEDPDWGQLDPTSVRLWLDGTDFTGTATIGIQPLPRGGKVGLWEGTLALTPLTPLEDRAHTLNVSAADRAGNTVSASFGFVVDGNAPDLRVNGDPLQHTWFGTHTISGTTEPNTSVNVRGTWIAVGPSGTFSETVDLLEGTNVLTVTAADWFETDAAGNPVAGNSIAVTQTVVLDVRAPEFVRWGTAPGGATQAGETVLTGQLRDALSDSELGRPDDVALRVTSTTDPVGRDVAVLSDGTFGDLVSLSEGANVITLRARDLAGNEVTVSLTVTKDTIAPTLSVSVAEGTAVTSSVVTIRGTTDVDAFVTVNGFSATVSNGSFEAVAILSRGRNRIVVQALDIAGNVATKELSVTYEDGGVSPGAAAAFLPAGAAVGALLAFLLVRAGIRIPLLSRRESPDEPTDDPTPGPQEPDVLRAGVVDEDPRVARLRAAFSEGRISKEAYEENLRRLKGSQGP